MTKKIIPGSDSGVALIAVLWILLLLSMMAAGYTSSTRLRAVAMRNQVEALKNRYNEESAYQRGYYEYKKYLGNRNLILRKGEAGEENEAVTKLWYPRYQPYPVASTPPFAVQILYAASRFDVNTLSASLWNSVLSICGVENKEQRAQIRESVLDWIDADNLHHLYGSETEYYLSKTPEYYCKNNKIQVLDELLLIRGITPDLYYGSNKHPGLIDFLSVYGSGDKIDINCASPATLALLQGLDNDGRNAILAARHKAPFQKLVETAEFVTPDVYSQLKKYFKIVQPPADIAIAVSSWPSITKVESWSFKVYRE